MPRTAEQNQRIREERRRAIVDAAIPIFAARGFTQASASEIAEAAGIAHGTVFLYFANKDELFHAAVLQPVEQLEAQLTVPAVPLGDVRVALERMVHEHIAVVRQHRIALRLLSYVVSQADRFPRLAEQVTLGPRFSERLAPLLEEGARGGELSPGRPLITGTAYLAYLFGLSQVVILDAGSPAWAEYAERALRILGAP